MVVVTIKALLLRKIFYYRHSLLLSTISTFSVAYCCTKFFIKYLLPVKENFQ